MKAIIVFIFFAQVQLISAQFANTYCFYETASKTSFSAPDPSGDGYFICGLQFKLSGGGYDLIIGKVDKKGVSQWYQIYSYPSIISNQSVNDLVCDGTYLYTAVTRYASPGFAFDVYKFDLTGNMLDSLNLTGVDQLKTEMTFDNSSHLVFPLTLSSGDVHYYRINTLDMSITDEQVIGSNPSGGVGLLRGLHIEKDGATTLAAFQVNTNINVTRLSATGIILDQFNIPIISGVFTGMCMVSSQILFLINETYITPPLPVTPSYNPLTLILADSDGTLLSTVSATPSIPLSYRDVVVDETNGEILISCDYGITGSRGGVLRLSNSGVIIDEIEMYVATSSEIWLDGNWFVLSGVTFDDITKCDTSLSRGMLLVRQPLGEDLNFDLVKPHTTLHSNLWSTHIGAWGVDGHYLYAPSSHDSIGSTLFANYLILGGKDQSGNPSILMRFSDLPLKPGPIMSPIHYLDLVENDKWNRCWKITKQEIDEHITAFQNGDPSYRIPEAIRAWPGNGNTSKGQSQQVAPFADLNNNTIYEPQLGEYPLILGTECVLSIYHANPYQTAGSCYDPDLTMKMQILEYTYTFSCDQDSLLPNAFFRSYFIHNLSGQQFDSCYVGNFFDIDIVNASSNYQGTDVDRSLIYGIHTPGLNSPECGMIVLNSKVDADGLDNSLGYGLNESVNGLGYGDGITDNEKQGIVSCILRPIDFMNGNEEIYNLYKGLNSTGAPRYYADTTSIITRYDYPGASDTLHYGTLGIDPGMIWDEYTESNSPGDRRGIATSGPFTMATNEIIRYDIAWVASESTAGNTAHEKLLSYTDSARSYFSNDLTPCGQNFDFYLPYFGTYPYADIENSEATEIIIYPNPADNEIMINGISNDAELTIYTLTGEIVIVMATSPNTVIDISMLPTGVYLIGVKDNSSVAYLKLIVT